MTKSELFNEVFKHYGAVTRARNCFLYTKKGTRLTDLYQEEGRAILGWEGGSAFTMLKNIISRGQNGSFICEEKSRIEKAVSELFASNRKVLFFYSKSDALAAGYTLSPEKTNYFRPWNSVNEKINIPEIDSLVFAPPLPWAEPVYLLALRSELLQADPDKTAFIKGSVKLPFSLETACTRSIYNLIKALQERQEKDWFIYDPVITKYWKREGPYLFPKISKEDYDRFVLHCLECGLIISPEYENPSIVPFGADRGNFTKLKNSPFEYK